MSQQKNNPNQVDMLYRLVPGRHGRFLINPNDSYVGKSMLTYGEYSEQECEVLVRLVPEGGIVVEAGANIGAFAVPMAKKAGPSGLVYAFEPQPLVFQLLCANAALNQLANIHAVNAGCGEETSMEVLRRINPAAPLNHAGLSLDQLRVEKGLKIPVQSLDDAIDPQRLDLIKADVEGMERDVIVGARELIRQHRPALYVENLYADTSPALISLILELDYDLWWHIPAMFNPRNFNNKTDNIFAGLVSYNMLCTHKDKPMSVSGGKKVESVEDHPSKWT
jgi:FkbM family methyltransferase